VKNLKGRTPDPSAHNPTGQDNKSTQKGKADNPETHTGANTNATLTHTSKLQEREQKARASALGWAPLRRPVERVVGSSVATLGKVRSLRNSSTGTTY
jgi:hypothetical protein